MTAIKLPACRGLARRWRSLSGYFVPMATAGDREAANRAQMFLISHLVGPILGNSALAALYAFDPTPQWDIVVLWASISLFWAFPFLLRWGIDYDRLVRLSVVNLNFCILFASYRNGGVASPTLTWALIIPLLSLFYLGGERRMQAHLLGIAAAGFAIFFVASSLVPPAPNDIPDAATIGIGAVSNLAVLCYVAMMAIYYARIYDAGVDLEIEVRRRRQMAEELRRAIVTTHRVSSAKAEFLARMSHEIRTPLNAIIGYGQILSEEADETDDRLLLEDVDRILDAANYLVRLTNMILDLAKLEAGRMVFDMREHRIAALLDEAVAARLELIARNGNRVVVDLAPGLDRVVADRSRFVQIVDAVIENAARFTRDGRIEVEARQEGAPGGQTFLRVSVSDTGCGIAPDAMAAVFQTFSTGRNAADGRYGGTGISLSVCSQLCRAMGGSIAVESALGRGSTFTISLPVAAEAPASPVPAAVSAAA